MDDNNKDKEYKEYDLLNKKYAERQIDRFNKSGLGLDAFSKKYHLADEGMKRYLKTEEKAIASGGKSNATYSKYAQSLKTAGIAMDFAAVQAGILNVALNTGILFVASMAIEGIVNIVDSLNTTLDETEEKIQELNSEYVSIQEDISTASKEQKTATDRIDELNGKDKLTLLEQGELEDLKDTNKELQTQIDLLEKQAKVNQQTTNKEIENKYNKQYGSKSRVQNVLSEAGTAWYDRSIYIGTEEGYVEIEIERLKELNKLKKQGTAFTADEKKEYEQISKYLVNVGVDYSNFAKQYTFDDATRQSWVDMADLINQTLDPDQLIEKIFDSAYNDKSFSKAKTELEAWASKGKLNPSVITSNAEYNSILKKTGLTAIEVSDKIYSLVNAEDSMSDSSSNAVKSLSDSISSLNDSTTLINSVNGDIKDTGSISEDTLNNIISKYPELETLIARYNFGLVSSGDIIKALTNIYQQDATNFQIANKTKLEESESFYYEVYSNLSPYLKNLASSYNLDLKNFTSVAAAKAGISAKLAQELSNAWNSVPGQQKNNGNADEIRTEKQILNKPNIKELLELYDSIINTSVNLQTEIDITTPKLDSSAPSDNNTGNTETKETKFSEQIDWAEQRIQILKNSIESFNNSLQNTTSFDNLKSTYEDLIEAQSELATVYKENVGTYNKKYTKALNNKYLTDADVENIQNGSYTIEQFKSTGDNSIDEKRFNAAQKAIEIRDKLSTSKTNLSSSINELKASAVQLADIPWDQASAKVDTLNNDIDELNEKLKNTNNSKKKNQLLDDILVDKKKIVDAYAGAVTETETNIDSLYDKIDIKNRVNSLGKSVASGTKISTKDIIDPTQLAYIVKYDKHIDELKKNTSALNLERQKYKGYVVETDTEKFQNSNTSIDEKLDKYDKLDSEIQNSLNYVDDNSPEQLALFQAGLLNSKNNVSALQTEINKLKKSYEKGTISVENYKDRLAELTDKLNNASSTSKSYYNDIVDAMKEIYDAQKEDLETSYNDHLKELEVDYNNLTESLNNQLDAYKNIIDAKKESLEADKKAKEYQDTINEQTDTITNIQSRVSELKKAADSGDREAIAEYKQLQEELADAQKELDDTQYDHQKDLEENSLDEAYTDYETLINGQLDFQKELYDQNKEDAENDYKDKLQKINKLYESESELIKAAAALTSNEFSIVFETINKKLATYGLSISSDLAEALKSANASNATDKPSTAGTSKDSSSLDKYSINHLLKTGSSLTGDSELNKYIKSKYNTYLNYSEMVQLAQMLGLKGIDDVSEVKGNGKNRTKILNALKAAKFSSGGTVDASESMFSELAQLTGEDGIALVKHNEEILTPDKARLVSNLLDHIQPLYDLSDKLINASISNNSTTNNNSAPIIQFNLNGGTISQDTMKDFNKWKSEIVSEVGKVINNKIRVK